jgi:signal transduction histidine kinase
MFNIHIPAAERMDMLYRLCTVLCIASILTIVVCLQSTRVNSFVHQLVYCYAAGFLIWLLIDVGDLLIFKNPSNRFPHSQQRYLFALIGTVVGTYGGFLIGDRFSGWNFLNGSHKNFFVWLAVNIFITYSLIWLFAQQHRHKAVQQSSTEMRLKLLESQLEPHMLFNTLANLRALISADPVLATRMLDRIVNYMRANLGGSRTNLHPLSTEFDRINDYLGIMKMRMGERLNYNMYLVPELNHHPVPPFILQPLVENAIKHGLEPKVEGGVIFIKAEIVNSTVVLEVNDSGMGVNKDDLLQTKGFGWAQVSERLITTYGHKSTINLIATDLYKTSAVITFPYHHKF